MAFVLFRLLATSVSCIPAFYNSKSPLFPLQNNTVVENIKKYLLLGHQIRRIQTIIIIQILCEPCRESGLWERETRVKLILINSHKLETTSIRSHHLPQYMLLVSPKRDDFV